MTDPFSIVTGVAGIITLAGEVISRCYRYGCAVSGAPDEAKRLVSEVTGLSGILVGVQVLVKQSSLPGYQLEHPLRNCLAVLQTLSSKLQKYSLDSSQSSGKRAVSRLLWPLRRSDTEELITAIERHKNSLSLSLSSLSVEALMSQSTTIEDISDSLADLSMNVKSSHAAQQRRDILDWLSEHQYEAQYQRSYQLHCSNTCRWLLADPAFLDWSKARSSLLWMHGQVGTGKTIATSYLIHHLITTKRSDSLLGYFYYDASTMESLTPESFFGAIIKQFCSDLPELPAEIVDAYARASNRTGSPKRASLGDLESFLRSLLESHDSATIVVDGLDESPNYAAVCDFLTSSVLAGKYALRVFISSRPELHLRRRFRGFQEIPVPEVAVEEDISVYIRMRINTNPRLRRMSDKMKHYVEMTLRADSHGMFRWVQCQLDEISRLRTDAALRKALNHLPSSLEGSYLRILNTIAPEDVAFAKKALLWLAHASTPLSLTELAEAVVLEPEFDYLDPDSKLNDPNDVIDICRSLIAFNPLSKTARIAHHSVREFLTERLDQTSEFYIPPQTSHRMIAEACLSYLLLDDFAAGPLYREDFSWTLSKFPLLRYAAQNWPFHVQSSGAELELLPLIRKLMTTKANPKFFFWLQVVLFDSRHGYLTPGAELEDARPLYYAASYGLTETVRSLVQAGANLDDCAGRYGGTALHAAVWRKQPEILDILLDAGADPTIKDYNGASPADLSIWSGSRSLYLRISERDRDRDSKNALAPLISAILRVREKELSATDSRLDAETKEAVSLVRSQPEGVIERLKEEKGFDDDDGDDDPMTLHFPAVRKEAYALAKLLGGGDTSTGIDRADDTKESPLPSARLAGGARSLQAAELEIKPEKNQD
ncbi:ankyrin repeat protein [Cladophialophora carrionii]|uniref:Ankyrin repeat protein n=1 Tax=Cladophialophora carrionii TaxID=86049 RepID=A0A1C1CFG8_9EURO|nr:ankyrin repeat protein [Cladophialophora carrionii]